MSIVVSNINISVRKFRHNGYMLIAILIFLQIV